MVNFYDRCRWCLISFLLFIGNKHLVAETISVSVPTRTSIIEETVQQAHVENLWQSLLPNEIGIGSNAYSETLHGEPLMTLNGSELTFRWSSDAEKESEQEWPWLIEYQVGQQNYRSDYSGSLNAVPNVQTRWQLNHNLACAKFDDLQWQVGMALHTTWNDLRGRTTFNQAGYLRTNASVWLPIGLLQTNPDVQDATMNWKSMRYEVGVLLRGLQTSHLSQVSNVLPDVTNTQTRGYYVEWSGVMQAQAGWVIRPYVRRTYVSDSDLVFKYGASYMEPKNVRTQLGVLFAF